MNGDKPFIKVVAALIWDKDKFLICQRPANKARMFPVILKFFTPKIRI